MKILKGILTGIGVLTALLCALIILSATNPEITKGLSAMLSGDAPSSEEETGESPEDTEGDDSAEASQEFPEQPVSSDIVDETDTTDTADITDTADAGATPEEEEEPQRTTARQPDAPVSDTPSEEPQPEPERVRGTHGYEQPLQSDIKIPTIVTGKNGYEPITEQSEAADGEYTGLTYGELGDGLTFDPLLYPYYQMLDEKGQHVYRQIYANANAMNEAFIPIEEVTVPEIKNAMMAVYNDHPELFWLNTTFTCKYDKNKVCAELDLDYNMTKEELDKASPDFYNTANNILTDLANLSPYDKETRLHDLLIREIDYDQSADMNQSAYSALVEKKSVCAGYARAYQYLMQRMGIPCYYCTGYAGQDHAWNIVALDDGYYNVDVTWDDTPGGEYDYFNKTDEDYANTHIRQDMSINLPQCQGQRYRVQ